MQIVKNCLKAKKKNHFVFKFNKILNPFVYKKIQKIFDRYISWIAQELNVFKNTLFHQCITSLRFRQFSINYQLIDSL